MRSMADTHVPVRFRLLLELLEFAKNVEYGDWPTVEAARLRRELEAICGPLDQKAQKPLVLP